MRYIRSLKKSCPFSIPCQNFIKTCPLRQVGLLPKTKDALETTATLPRTLTQATQDYSRKFSESIQELKNEGRYREFISIKRQAGQYPIALNLHNVKQAENITVWCSNDYLGKKSII